MIRVLISASPKKRTKVFVPIRINKQNHELRKSERSSRCISIFHRLHPPNIIPKVHSPSRFVHKCEGDAKSPRRLRGSTPHEHRRRLIVRSARSWRVAGDPDHFSVDRPRRRRSRSLTPGSPLQCCITATTYIAWCTPGVHSRSTLFFYTKFYTTLNFVLPLTQPKIYN